MFNLAVIEVFKAVSQERLRAVRKLEADGC